MLWLYFQCLNIYGGITKKNINRDKSSIYFPGRYDLEKPHMCGCLVKKTGKFPFTVSKWHRENYIKVFFMIWLPESKLANWKRENVSWVPPLLILLLTPYLPINLLVLRPLRFKFLIQLVIKPITFYGNMVALLKVDTYGKMYKKLRIWGEWGIFGLPVMLLGLPKLLISWVVIIKCGLKYVKLDFSPLPST